MYSPQLAHSSFVIILFMPIWSLEYAKEWEVNVFSLRMSKQIILQDVVISFFLVTKIP